VENEVVIHVRAEDDTGPTFAAIRAKAKKLGEDVERDLKQSGTKAGRSLADGISDGLARGRAVVTREADKIGDAVVRQMDSSGDKAGRELAEGIKDGLDHAAPVVVAQATVLGNDVEDEMREAGKRGGRALGDGIDEGMRGAGGGSGGPNIGEKLAGAMTAAGRKAGSAGGAAAAEGFAGKFGSLLSGHPAISAAVIGLSATIAPLLAANIGGAVIGTGGLLGIAGGFAASVKDPRVKGSLQELKKQVSTDLKAAGSDFAPAAVDAVGQVGDAWTKLMPTIRSVFSKSADLITPFLDGVLDGVAGLAEGIEESLDGAGPVMQALGDLVRDFGSEFGEVFSELEDDSAALADSINFLSDVLGFLLDAVTVVIEVSADWISQFPALAREIQGAADSVSNWIDMLDGTKDAVEEVDLRGAQWHDGIDDGTQKIERQIGALQALSDEMNKQTDPLYALIDAQSAVSDAQERYNEALRKHGPKSEEARDALIKVGKAASNVSSAAAKAADSGFDGSLTPAMRNVMRQAGLSKTEINRLESALRSARGAADRWEGTFTQTYITRYKEYGLKSPSGGMGGFQGHASGGITGAATGGMHTGMKMVGEHGPELISLPPGSHVYSNPDSSSLMAKEAAGRAIGQQGAPAVGFSNAVIKFDASGSNRLVRAIMEMLRGEIRSEGGSVQKVLGTYGVG